MLLKVRNLCANDAVDTSRCTWFVLFQEDQKNMSMRETTFLVFDSVHIGDNFTEDVLLENVFEKGIKLKTEYPSGEIWPVFSLLTFLQL